MPKTSAKVDPTGGAITAEVIFGQAQVGNYTCYLWPNSTATTATVVAQGNNVDNLPDLFSVPGAPATLPGQILGFHAVVQTPVSGPGQLYSATILLRQDGRVIQGGLIQEQGQFPDGASTVSLLDYVVLS